ncbi:MAG TPA: hypothetical protein DGG95_01875 [Cytophagales bacterium]|jgi:hypothetical protein|nr:hypothetical protein [Cytophagales bacterium]
MALPFRFFVFVIANFVCASLVAQQQADHQPVKINFYYNENWELTSSEKSVYKREAFFDLVDMVFEGVYSDYDKGGKLIADGFYSHGIKSGIHTEYSNNNVHKKIEYADNDFTIWEWNDGQSEGVKNGTGKFYTSYYYFVNEDGAIKGKQGFLTGEFRNGRRVGKWRYINTHAGSVDEEIYVNGKLNSHRHYNSEDTTILMTNKKKTIYLSINALNTEALMYDATVFTSLNQYFEQYVNYHPAFKRNVTYPGGWKKLLTLLAQAAVVPENTIELLRIKIDEHGQITKFDVAVSISPIYDELCQNIFDLHKERLFPAINNGKPTSMTVYIPIAGGEAWMNTLQEMPTAWFFDYSNFY